MQFYVLIPVLVALATVTQAGLNKTLAQTWGLPGVCMLNALVFLIGCGIFYVFARRFPEQTPQILENLKPFSSFKAWYLLPGLCGVVIVVGLPMGFATLGAFKLMTILVGSQIVLGILWDTALSGSTITGLRVLGALITIVGVAVSVAAR